MQLLYVHAAECSHGPWVSQVSQFQSVQHRKILRSVLGDDGRAGDGESLIMVDAAPWASGRPRPSVVRGPHKQVSLLQGWHFGSVGAARADGAALAHSLTVPSQSTSAPIQSSAIHIHRAGPSIRRDGRHKTLRQRPLCPRKLRITLLFSPRLRSLDRDNQFENRFLALKLLTPLDVDSLHFLSHFQSFLTSTIVIQSFLGAEEE